ncbi:porin OmpL1 [Leptospira sp. WS58.C1]|uniref:porin OmpL1 n=1 Tax=Leptospira cinconiae TaxID=3235173 RepID=UPI00349EE827
MKNQSVQKTTKRKQNLKTLGIMTLLVFTSSILEAKTYVFGGLGLQFNLGALGDTITKDGLESSTNYPDTATDGTPGILPRRLIVPENRMITLDKSTNGLISAKTGGPMTGLVLSFGYEQDFGKAFFWRVNANYTRKLLGGESEAKFLGAKFAETNWDYNAVQIPFNIGIKLNVSDDASFYIGGGVHYFKGGWTLGGSNFSEVVHDQLVALGVSSNISNLLQDGTDPPAIFENTRFSVSGVAPNWIVGAQARLSDKGHIYIEAETLYSFKYGIAHPSSIGGIAGLAPSVSYPIVLGGTQYRVGYKHEI